MRTVEEIVKEKQYFELTNEELLLVSELAKNQEEYDQLKFLLTESTSFYNQNRIEASDGMRDHIMEKLYPPTANKPLAWYQSLWLFLFPPHKQIFMYPAFQLAGICILFIGIFSLLKSPFDEKTLAQNKTVKKEVITEEDVIEPLIDDKPIAEEGMEPPEDIEDELKEKGSSIRLDNKDESLNRELSDEKIAGNTSKDIKPIFNSAFDTSPATVSDNIIALEEEIVAVPESPDRAKYLEALDTEEDSYSDEVTKEIINANNTDAEQVKVLAAEKQDLRIVSLEGKRKSKSFGNELNKSFTDKSHSVTDINGLLELFFEIK